MAPTDPRQLALNALSQREHSRLEIAHKLTHAGFSSTEIEPLLDDLINNNWLNEERFVEAFVRRRFQQGYGPLKIRAELQQRGISQEMITEGLLKYQHQWAQSAKKLRCRRFGNITPSDQKMKAKQIRFLVNRGFLPDHIRYALTP